jgi:hypothetical protein
VVEEGGVYNGKAEEDRGRRRRRRWRKFQLKNENRMWRKGRKRGRRRGRRTGRGRGR